MWVNLKVKSIPRNDKTNVKTSQDQEGSKILGDLH